MTPAAFPKAFFDAGERTVLSAVRFVQPVCGESVRQSHRQ
jgi:hypothetical protein